MQYDIIEDAGYYEATPNSFMSIGDLIDVCEHHPSTPVQFLGTSFTVGELGSWRGSYDLPAVSYESSEKTGKQVALELKASLGEVHYGYKGGEYRYGDRDEFYVASYGSSSELKVVKAEVVEGVLTLYTKVDPY